MVDTTDITIADQRTGTIAAVVVDDQELMRQGLVDLLSGIEDLVVTGTAATAEEAVPLVERTAPDLVLLEARLPEGAGIATCRELRSARPGLRCVLLTAFDDEEALLASVLAGAAGYVVMEIGGTSVVDGVRTVGRGFSLLDPRRTEDLLSRLQQVAHGTVSSSLTGQELQVLELVLDGRTDSEVAAKLSLAPHSVQVGVASIFAKLGSRQRTGLAESAGAGRPLSAVSAAG
jgi:two-component system response regulator DevR